MEETTQVSRWNKPVSELTTKDQLIITGAVVGGLLALSTAYGVTVAAVSEFRARRAAKKAAEQAKDAKKN